MSENILLIDDEKEFIEALADRMETRDIHVTASTSPQEALAFAQQEAFDAVILDLQMPEMDGLQVLAQLKNSMPDLQVILLTGHATVEKGVQAMKLGAMDVVEKPADIQVLVDKIKKASTKKILLVEKRSQESIQHIIQTKCW